LDGSFYFCASYWFDLTMERDDSFREENHF
jgi:hypothetical protein